MRAISSRIIMAAIIASAVPAHAAGKLWIAFESSTTDCKQRTTDFFNCILDTTNFNQLALQYTGVGEGLTLAGTATVNCAPTDFTCVVNSGGFAITKYDVVMHFYGTGWFGGTNGYTTVNGVFINTAWIETGNVCDGQSCTGSHEAYEAATDGVSADCCNGQQPPLCPSCQPSCSQFTGAGGNPPNGCYSLTCGGTVYSMELLGEASNEFQAAGCQRLQTTCSTAGGSCAQGESCCSGLVCTSSAQCETCLPVGDSCSQSSECCTPNENVCDTATGRCAPFAPPAGVKRAIASMSDFTAWKFATSAIYTVPDATLNGVSDGVGLPGAPSLVKSPDAPEIWLIDNGFRRHVPNPAVMTAWHFDQQPLTTMSDAAIAAIPQGPDVWDTPVLMKGSMATVYLVDAALPNTSAPDGGAGGGGGAEDAGAGATHKAGGCCDSGGSSSTGMLTVLVAFAFLRRRTS